LPRVRHPRTLHCAEYPSGEQLNLFGHALFFVQARIVGANALD
jgi:hypothetical protein